MDIKFKYSFIGLLVVVVTFTGYYHFLIKGDESTLKDNVAVVNETAVSIESPVAEVVHETTLTLTNQSDEELSASDALRDVEEIVDAHIQANPEKFSWMNEGDLHIIYKWIYSSQGFHFQEAGLYESYSTETLEELADQGDSVALYVLPRRYMEEQIASDEDRPDLQEKIDKTYIKAAAYGSGYALRRKAGDISIVTYGEQDEIKRRKLHIAAMSYLTVAERRGYGDAMLDKVDYVKQYSIEPFSQEELAEINNNADKIYNELEQERRNLGLPPFDNSVPEIVERYYESLVELRKVRAESENG